MSSLGDIEMIEPSLASEILSAPGLIIGLVLLGFAFVDRISWLLFTPTLFTMILLFPCMFLLGPSAVYAVLVTSVLVQRLYTVEQKRLGILG